MANSMHVVITGGTGMIGRALTAALFSAGHTVTVLSRRSSRTGSLARANVAEWDPESGEFDLDKLGTVDVVVNLAGASLARMPWTAGRRRAILQSRRDATRTIVSAIASAKHKPALLINGSAVGIYGNRGDVALAEDVSSGTGFLADVVTQWEQAARECDPSVRLVLARTGLVIGPEGALSPLRKLASLSLAGPFGRKKLWWPWISLHDTVRALMFIMTTRAISGPVNLVGPTPATARQVVRALARRMHRAYWLPVPEFAIKLLLGMAGKEMLLASQKVVPTHLVACGFTFDDHSVDRAIARALRDADFRAGAKAK